jgi:hypothetical protein
MDQVSIKYIYQHVPLQDPPKFNQIWILVLKINHLATLLGSRRRNRKKLSASFLKKKKRIRALEGTF